MSTSKKVLWALSALFVTQAWAATNEYFLEIVNPKCEMGFYKRSKQKFKKSVRPLSTLINKTLIGRSLESTKSMAVFRVLGDEDNELFAAPMKCFKRGSVYDPDAPDVTAIKIRDADDLKIEDINADKTPRRPGYYYVGLLSWQEPITVIRKAGLQPRAEYKAAVTAALVCPGFGTYILALSQSVVSWDTCVAPVGIAEVGYKASESSYPDFHAKNARVIAIMSGPTLSGKISEKLNIGVSVPFTFRFVNLPHLDSTFYEKPHERTFFPSVLLTTQYTTANRWVYSYKIGMLKTWPGYAWGFSVGKAF